jgi:CHAT domain-containing protein
MNASEFVETLVDLGDAVKQRNFIEEQSALLNDEVANLLKQKADHFLRADTRACFEIADLLRYVSDLTRNPAYQALALLVEANTRSIGLGEYTKAIELYDEAAEIYRSHGYVAEQARSQVGKVGALANLSLFGEALKVGQWAAPILEAYQQWRPLATLTMNLGALHGYQGEDAASLAMFDRAGELFKKIGQEGETAWAMIQQNRAVALRNMGHFDDSIVASQASRDAFLNLDEKIEAARAQQGLALTYFMLGRFNEALELLDHIREVFLSDTRVRDATLVDLYISNCLLQLRRFPDVVEKCRQVRSLFAGLGAHQVEGLAIINEAVAFAELRQYDNALTSLTEARQIFEEANNEVRVASTDLERAAVLYCQGHHAESLNISQQCIEVFKGYQLPIEQAQALIVAARAAFALQQHSQAQSLLREAMQMAEKLNIPTVRYQAHSLLGALSLAEGDAETARKEYELAIQEVEQLRGRLMVEFRVSFLEDKETLYQDMVDLCIDHDQPLLGLDFTERAKCRALLDLLAYRLDLTIQAKNPQDQSLVEELVRLRSERDRLYRRWENNAESGAETDERGWSSSQSVLQKAQHEVLTLETKITELWHRLLIHNADYAREAALWTVRTESVQPYLEDDTLLIEYYVVKKKMIVFLVTKDCVQARRLEMDLDKIQTLMQLLQLNLRSAPKSPLQQMPALTKNAQALLQQLYRLLIAPMEDVLADYAKLIIVPHGNLHYLPFHALFDGTSYLLERKQISYLPNASSLRYCREVQPITQRGLVLGHSHHGQLPFAVQEARKIADLLHSESFIEEQATLDNFHKAASGCRTLHLATHGDFRLDNPLFSGLALADGWLTTMDIFNLRLNASLVTLSACQTGLNVVGGGDELLGLMRAFLSAGTASMALTLWSVEDRSTAQIMESFYHNMADGKGKGEALRQAQLQLLRSESKLQEVQMKYYAHPYFWAPFFLVGDAGPL